jgi:hypothetical protein
VLSTCALASALLEAFFAARGTQHPFSYLSLVPECLQRTSTQCIVMFTVAVWRFPGRHVGDTVREAAGIANAHCSHVCCVLVA